MKKAKLRFTHIAEEWAIPLPELLQALKIPSKNIRTISYKEGWLLNTSNDDVKEIDTLEISIVRNKTTKGRQ